MLRGVLNWLTARFGDEEEGDDQAEDTRFIPSVLDASVRYAHGGSNTGLEHEIATIEEEAQRLEEQQRGK